MDTIDRTGDGAPRLTSLAHGGGCGCKLSPGILKDLLSSPLAGGPFERLLVGNETADDAAVWDLDGQTAIIATTDFFMPMVDDPHAFGRIAATNAISDVYAMGGRPIMALAILGMPVGKLDTGTIRRILEGGAATCAAAGIPVAGGHSIDCPEPVYGLAVIGTCAKSQLRRNGGAQAGDRLILTKPLGVGIYSAAFKKDRLPPEAYGEMIASTTRLNAVGARLAERSEIHAMTDVTGFGILGHGLEMARASGRRIRLDVSALPVFGHARSLCEAGFVTGASHRNWASYGAEVQLPAGLPEPERHLLTDPQTSGGLLVSCAPEAAEELLAVVREGGDGGAAIVGEVFDGPPGIEIGA